jgi:sulfite reductase alpha subunit-like flavoprotein
MLIYAESRNPHKNKLYVQNVIHNLPNLILHQLESIGKIYVCGSNAMVKELINEIKSIIKEHMKFDSEKTDLYVKNLTD